MLTNSNFENIGRITRISFQIILLLQVIIALILKNKGNCFFSVWYNLGYLSLIHWIPMINLNPGTELKSLLNEFSSLLKPFSLPEICVDEAIDDQIYKDSRIKSNGFINNAKELLLIYLFFILLCILILITFRSTSSAFWRNIINQIKWNAFIRIHLIVFLDFITLSLINIYYFSTVTICSVTNLALSLILVLIGGIWIFMNPVILKKKINSNPEEHHSVVFKEVSTLVNEFKPVFEISKFQFYTIFLLYRFSLALNIVLLSNSPSIQILLVSSFQVLISNFRLVLYIGLSKPFKSKKDAFTVFISEFFTLLLVLLIGFRSLGNVADSLHIGTSIICVCILWLNELVIIIRFILTIHDARSKVLPGINTSTIFPARDNLGIGSRASNKSSENVFIQNVNNTELIESIEAYNSNETYKYLQTKQLDTLKDSSSSRIHLNLPPIKEIVTKKSSNPRNENPNNKKPNIDQDKSAHDSTEIIQRIDYSQYPDHQSGSSIAEPPGPNLPVPLPSTLPNKSTEAKPNQHSSRFNHFHNLLFKNKNFSNPQDSVLQANPSQSGIKRLEVIKDSQIKEFLAKASEISLHVGNKGLS